MNDFGLYMEIVDFLHSGGGPYEVMNGDVQENLIDSLCSSRYVLQRDDYGKIKAFCNYWLVMPEDLDTVRAGHRPAEVNTGSVFVMVDHVNKGGRRSLLDTIRQLRIRCVNVKGAAWFHKQAAPEMFRYYPSQRGTNG